MTTLIRMAALFQVVASYSLKDAITVCRWQLFAQSCPHLVFVFHLTPPRSRVARHPQQVEWSCDSKYILCAMSKRQSVQVVPVDMADDWTCSVCEGAVAGLVREGPVSPPPRCLL